MAKSGCTIHIFPTDVISITGETTTLWHWKRLNGNGAQIDGSGGQRHGLETKKAAVELTKGKYPDDKFV